MIDAPSDLGLRPPAEGAVPGCYQTPGVLRDLGILDRLGASDGGVVPPGRYVGTWSPVVLGGDCSISLGAMLALRRTGRYGIAYLDGHDDFRHLGLAPHVGAAAGEDLAIMTGRGADAAYMSAVDSPDPDGRQAELVAEILERTFR